MYLEALSYMLLCQMEMHVAQVLWHHLNWQLASRDNQDCLGLGDKGLTQE